MMDMYDEYTNFTKVVVLSLQLCLRYQSASEEVLALALV